MKGYCEFQRLGASIEKQKQKAVCLFFAWSIRNAKAHKYTKVERFIQFQDSRVLKSRNL